MIAPDVGRAAFGVAVFVTLTALLLLPFLPRDSAEFVATVFAAVLGGLVIILIVIMTRLANR